MAFRSYDPGAKRRWWLAAVCAVFMVLFTCGSLRQVRGEDVRNVGDGDEAYGPGEWKGQSTLGELEGRVNVSDSSVLEPLHRNRHWRRQIKTPSSKQFKKAVKRGKAILEATEGRGRAARSEFDKVSNLQDFGMDFDRD